MSDIEYQGWTNYETFVVNVWLTSDAAAYQHCRDIAAACRESAEYCDQVTCGIWTVEEARKFSAADQLRDWIELLNPLLDTGSMFSDLLTSALSEVNWTEIAEAFVEE